MGAFGSPEGGATALFADGSVREIPKEIDPKVFEAICTMNGGETVDRNATRELLSADMR